MRLSEWVLAVYFAYVTALSFILPVQPGVPLRTIIVNGFVLCIYSVLLRFPESIVVRHLRNWIPLALMLLAYKEMGWLAPASYDHHLEQSWIVCANSIGGLAPCAGKGVRSTQLPAGFNPN